LNFSDCPYEFKFNVIETPPLPVKRQLPILGAELWQHLGS
jgi:hypothetical protein